MTNKYGGSCSSCRTRVPAGAGVWTREHGLRCASCAAGHPVQATKAEKKAQVKAIDFVPTSEQLTVLDLTTNAAREQLNIALAIQAGAGTGKTATLRLIVREFDRLGLVGTYTAFNTAIVRDSEAKFEGTGCTAHTSHKLAMDAIGYRYRHRLQVKVYSREMAKQLNIEPFFFSEDGEDRVIQAPACASFVMDGIKRYCYSADFKLTPKHIRRPEKITTPENLAAFRSHLSRALVAAWDDICKKNGTLQFTHDHYFKMWALGDAGEPEIPGDYVLVDEAQDTAPVFADILARQHKLVIFVGDAQQSIYGWRGAVDAMTRIDSTSTAWLTNSFRFGPEIAEIANTVLSCIEGAELRLIGVGGPSTVGRADKVDAIVCRTNGGVIKSLISSLTAGLRVYIPGGAKELFSFAAGAAKLQAGQKTENAFLCVFDTWQEVLDYIVSDDPAAEEIALFVRLCDSYGAAEIVRLLNTCVEQAKDADITITTAHKSKGLEWDTVRLCEDFPAFGVDEETFELSPDPEAARTLYVALTRARKHLDATACKPLLQICSREQLGMAPPTTPEVVSPDQEPEAVVEVPAASKRPAGSSLRLAVQGTHRGRPAPVQNPLQAPSAPPQRPAVPSGASAAAKAVREAPAAPQEPQIDEYDRPAHQRRSVSGPQPAPVSVGDVLAAGQKPIPEHVTAPFDGTEVTTVTLQTAQTGDLVRGAFYRSRATGNVQAHYGEVEHLARVTKRYGAYYKHVWAKPICGTKEGRILSAETAATRKGHMSICEKCSKKLAKGEI
jgi:hypothetical protein